MSVGDFAAGLFYGSSAGGASPSDTYTRQEIEEKLEGKAEVTALETVQSAQEVAVRAVAEQAALNSAAVDDLQTEINNITGIGIAIPNNADLDEYTNPGSYYSQNAAVSETIKNTPYKTGGFRLIVMQTIGNAGSCVQILFPNAIEYGAFWVRNGYSDGRKGSWYKYSAEKADSISADTSPNNPDILMDPESFEMVGIVPETENKEDKSDERKKNL